MEAYSNIPIYCYLMFFNDNFVIYFYYMQRMYSACLKSINLNKKE